MLGMQDWAKCRNAHQVFRLDTVIWRVSDSFGVRGNIFRALIQADVWQTRLQWGLLRTENVVGFELVARGQEGVDVVWHCGNSPRKLSEGREAAPCKEQRA
jgi:hypothetical protein